MENYQEKAMGENFTVTVHTAFALCPKGFVLFNHYTKQSRKTGIRSPSKDFYEKVRGCGRDYTESGKIIKNGNQIDIYF